MGGERWEGWERWDLTTSRRYHCSTARQLHHLDRLYRRAVAMARLGRLLDVVRGDAEESRHAPQVVVTNLKAAARCAASCALIPPWYNGSFAKKKTIFGCRWMAEGGARGATTVDGCVGGRVGMASLSLRAKEAAPISPTDSRRPATTARATVPSGCIHAAASSGLSLKLVLVSSCKSRVESRKRPSEILPSPTFACRCSSTTPSPVEPCDSLIAKEQSEQALEAGLDLGLAELRSLRDSPLG